MPAACSRCNRVSAVNTAHLTALHLALLLVTAAATTTATASAAAQHVLPIRAHASSSPSSSSGCASLSSTATTWSAAMHSQHAGYPAGPAEATAAAGRGAPVPAAGPSNHIHNSAMQQQHSQQLQRQQQQQQWWMLLPPAQHTQQHVRMQHEQQQQQHSRHLLQQQQPPQDQQTPAQRAAARWYERQRQQQAGTVAGPTAANTHPSDPEFLIPVPPPGAPNPHEVQVPLYSPDQLRIRHKLIPGVPLESQIISLQEQLQQAESLGVELTSKQLEEAYPLLGPAGPVKVPDKDDPAEFPDGYMAICAIVKNQARDIREWLEYHRWLGVGKVYVYDNNSTAPLSTHITDMLHSGFVEYSFFTGQQRYRDLFRTSSQWWAYNDCVQRFRHRHRWLAFIDADEFIVLREPRFNPPSWEQQQQQQQGKDAGSGVVGSSDGGSGSSAAHDDINTFLQPYASYGGLAVNWVIFGSSGHAARPRGGVLVNYHACLPDQHEQNTHVKVIANTRYILTVGDDPHRVYYKSAQHWTVNELGEKVTHARTGAPTHTKIALYHYLTKSEQEYLAKMKRGSAAGNYKSPEFFHTINQYATDSCTAGIPLGLKCCPSVLRELGPQGVQQVKGRLAALQQRKPTGAGDA